MNEFHALPVQFAPVTGLTLCASRPRASLRDPALRLYTDLRSGAVVVVQPDDSADSTLALLVRAGVRMALVGSVREGSGDVQGLVTASDLAGERATLRALERGVAHHELTAADLMTPLSQWPSVEFGALGRAQVGDVIATLRATGRRYLLVTETSMTQTPLKSGVPVTRLRGLFSASRIEQALETALPEDLQSRSFAELRHALDHA
ncbi:hypothetical protein [Caldimonas sp. KR1-144]|uniref:hypothetical protein n=1 Tax=Caldimonas sp. KR1-144 TaxID=3400911 RepID=UPI003C07CDC0